MLVLISCFQFKVQQMIVWNHFELPLNAPENKAHGLSLVLYFSYLIHMSNDIVGVMLIHLCYSLIHVYTVTLCSKQDSSLTAINLNK